MNHVAIEHALLAVLAARGGDDRTAAAHIDDARRHTSGAARRERHVVEIAALVVAGELGRAAGLALEHESEFPEDTALLARIAPCSRR